MSIGWSPDYKTPSLLEARILLAKKRQEFEELRAENDRLRAALVRAQAYVETYCNDTHAGTGTHDPDCVLVSEALKDDGA